MINEFGELSKDLSGLISEDALAVECFEMFPELLIVVVVVVVVVGNWVVEFWENRKGIKERVLNGSKCRSVDIDRIQCRWRG